METKYMNCMGLLGSLAIELSMLKIGDGTLDCVAKRATLDKCRTHGMVLKKRLHYNAT